MSAIPFTPWTFPIEALSEIKLEMQRGSLRMARGEGSMISIHLEEGDLIADQLQARITGSLLAISQLPSHQGQPVRIVILVPPTLESLRLEARLNMGSVEVEDFQDRVSVRTNAGSIRFIRCRGECSAHTNSGAVELEDCSGRLRLRTDAGEISLGGCQGTLEAHAGAGTLRLENCSLEGRGETGDGDLWLDRVVGRSSFRTGAGNITALHPQGEYLELNTGMGGITIEAGNLGALRLHTGAGDLNAVGLTINGALEARTGAGNINLEADWAAGLQVSTGAGDLHYAGALGEGDHLLETGAGSIEVGLPPGARLRVEAITRMGTVHSDFGLVKVGRPGPVLQFGARFVGTIGENEANSTLHLKTGAGDIQIQRLYPDQPVREGAEETGAGILEPTTPPWTTGCEPTILISGCDPGPPPQDEEDGARLAILESLQSQEITVEEAMGLLAGLD